MAYIALVVALIYVIDRLQEHMNKKLRDLFRIIISHTCYCSFIVVSYGLPDLIFD